MGFKSFGARLESREPAGPGGSVGGGTTTYIDASCEFEGKLRFRETVRIDGSVEGEIGGDNTLIVGPSAVVRARITAESVVVYGEVVGEICASRKITLHQSARVKSDMRSAGITIYEGACFEGSIVIGSAEASASARPRRGRKRVPERANADESRKTPAAA